MDTTGTQLETPDALSRRSLIRRAAVAGMVWTTPFIIDSFASPAAAGTPGACVKYWVKVTASGACSPNCPGSGNGVSFNVSDALWAGSCGHPGGCDAGDGSTHMPSVTLITSNLTDYYQVTLPSGCFFSSETDWQIGGRYETSTGSCPGDYYLKVSGSSCGSVPTEGSVGCFTNGGSTAWIRKRAPSTSRDLCYVYLKFCCSE
jgi:hypothetical protein